MVVLGLGGAVGHDPAAALVVDGKIVAAAEEERFLREKHAKGKQAEQSALFCLKQAGVKPGDVQAVAYPYAPISIFGPERWHYAFRHLYAPDRALTAILNGNRRYRRNVANVREMLKRIGIDPAKIKFVPVEHHVAHASSAYHLSGYPDAAIMSIDGVGEGPQVVFAQTLADLCSGLFAHREHTNGGLAGCVCVHLVGHLREA